MSFILDALRKSEHERQRQTGPALVESPVAAPAPRTNRWATAAIVLLVINLIAVGVVLLSKSRNGPAATTASPSSAPGTTVATASPGSAGTMPAAATAPAAAGPSTVPSSGAQAQTSVARASPAAPPMMRPADQHPVATGRNPLMEEAAVEPPPMADAVASGAATPPRGPPAVQSDAPVRPGRVIYESLPEAGRVTSPPGAVAADGATSASKLPRADEIAARLGSPELRLELHVYSTRPAERMVFINSRQYHEGDTTQEGALVEQITPDGVVLSMNGSRFLLARE